MMIETMVKDDGMLVVKVPDRYKGKTVRVSIQETGVAPSSQWEAISRILQEADQLNLLERTHEEILREIRAFRETE